MEKNISWEKLAKFFAGELNHQEHEKMKSWIKADPKREQKINELYKIWEESEIPLYKLNVDKAWAKLSSDIDDLENVTKQTASNSNIVLDNKKIPFHDYRADKLKSKERLWRRAILVAASVLIVLTGGYFSYQWQVQQEQAESLEEQNRILLTNYGERATYVLNDDTKVMLHAGSRIEIPKDYNQDIREIYLEGEAYFEVNHNPEKPFLVHSNGAYTRVLGTRFIVQAWPDSKDRIEVIVSEGKVAFGKNTGDEIISSSEVLVTKNKMGIMQANGETIVSDVSDMGWYTGWTEGILKFNDREMAEVIPRLERWYDLEIEVKPQKILREKITAEIDYRHSMSEVLQGIAMTLDLRLERQGRKVTFVSSE
jgi:ferric-dicitrate binding protein FerR (iron transport regulator)